MEERASLGYLIAKVETLELEVKTLREDVIVLRTKLDEMKGGWKLLAALMAASAAAGAMATAVASWVSNKGH